MPIALFSLLALLTGASVAFGQSLTARIRVEADFKPESANGIIFSRRGVVEKIGVDIRELSPGVFVVSFPIEGRENSPDRFATAVALGPDQALAFGTTVPISMVDSAPNLSALPDCAPEDRRVAAEGQSALLERLITLRKTKVELGKQKLTSLIDSALVARIEKLERGFGLSRAEPLGPETDPRELTDRLRRLMLAIDNYGAHKKKAAPPTEN